MKKLAISLAVLTACTQIHAVELGKSFVELGYGNTDFGARYFDPKGVILNGQFQANIIGAELNKQRESVGSIDLDHDENTLKLGYAYINEDDTQLVFGAEFGGFKLSSRGRSESVDTKRVFSNYEVLLNDSFAVNGLIGYEKLEHDNDNDNSVTFGLGASYYFTDNVRVSLDYFDGTDYKQTSLRFRYNF